MDEATAGRVCARTKLHFSVARGSRILQGVLKAFVRGGGFHIYHGTLDFWLATTAMWCIRRRQISRKKRDPTSFVVGSSGEMQLSWREAHTLSYWGEFVSFRADVFVRELSITTKIVRFWSGGFKFDAASNRKNRKEKYCVGLFRSYF